MYKTVEIKNFRLFKDFKIEGLERINLFAGANNVGKTALLEALFLAANPYNRRLPSYINFVRGLDFLKADAHFLWETLFSYLDMDNEIAISLTSLSRKKSILKIRLSTVSSTELSINQKINTSEIDFSKPLSTRRLELWLNEDGNEKLTAFAYFIQNALKEESTDPDRDHGGLFLPATSTAKSTDIAAQFSRLVVLKEEGKIIQYIQDFEPKIKDLKTISWGDQSMIYGDIGEDKLFPLYSLGQGTNHLLTILLEISRVPGGIIMIDEIENGIYYKSMPKVWQIIRQMAMDYDVQVFTTTHSEECLYAAHQAFHDLEPYNFRFFRLSRQDDQIIPVEYDRETLNAAIEMNLEVR
ncbi:MAG: AAA family ATPase [bacterium]